MASLKQIVDWGPVFFGLLIFGPMWAAVLDAAQLALPLGVSNLAAMMILGLLWGALARWRGRWL